MIAGTRPTGFVAALRCLDDRSLEGEPGSQRVGISSITNIANRLGCAIHAKHPEVRQGDLPNRVSHPSGWNARKRSGRSKTVERLPYRTITTERLANGLWRLAI